MSSQETYSLVLLEILPVKGVVTYKGLQLQYPYFSSIQDCFIDDFILDDDTAVTTIIFEIKGSRDDVMHINFTKGIKEAEEEFQRIIDFLSTLAKTANRNIINSTGVSH